MGWNLPIETLITGRVQFQVEYHSYRKVYLHLRVKITGERYLDAGEMLRAPDKWHKERLVGSLRVFSHF